MNTERIKDAIDSLNSLIWEAQSFGHVCRDLGGDNPPEWTYCVDSHMGRIGKAAESLERLLRQEVIPALEGRTPKAA